MKYIYGPLKSRRLGFSLGLTLTPTKVCNLNCVYCQLGKTTKQLNERKEYLPIEEIFGELEWWLKNNPEEAKKLACITLSGSGEPTLNNKIGELILKIKGISNLPVTVITNGSLLNDSAVRRDLLAADLIIPSLDAADPKVFAKVDRPHPDLKIEDIIEGLIKLKKEFRGKIWLEIMIIKGINDDLRHIKRLKEAVEKINPDKVQLNSPVRSTAEPDILPVNKKKLEKIKEIIGGRCEII